MHPTAFFVTGTDTEVGKTAVGSALLYKAMQQGLTTAASKPVACGTFDSPQGPINEDVQALMPYCTPALAMGTINPWLFEAPTSPHIAATEAGVSLNVDAVVSPITTVLQLKRQITIVEGAGGWHVPISGEEDLADVAIALGLPVIIVVGIKLGALNHALLTYNAVRNSGLEIAGWVANTAVPAIAEHRLDQYLALLHQRWSAPCLGVVPYLDSPSPAAVATYLDLNALWC